MSWPLRIFVLLVVAVVVGADALACSRGAPESGDPRVAADETALERQRHAIQAMQLENVDYSRHGPIEVIRGRTGIVLPPDIAFRHVGTPSDDILPLVADILLANGTESLEVTESERAYGSARNLSLSQSIRGIPVLDGLVSMEYETSTREVSVLAANFLPDRGLPRTPRLSARNAEAALRRALAIAEALEPASVRVAKGTRLGYFVDHYNPVPAQLVWAMEAYVHGERELFYVDALTGLVAHRRSLVSHPPPRSQSPDVVGARCKCPDPPRRGVPQHEFTGRGRLVNVPWNPLPGVDRYVGQMANEELGWVFADLVIDTSATQCACEITRPVYFRVMACNSCGCGPWSEPRFIDVKAPGAPE